VGEVTGGIGLRFLMSPTRYMRSPKYRSPTYVIVVGVRGNLHVEGIVPRL